MIEKSLFKSGDIIACKKHTHIISIYYETQLCV